MHAIDNNKHRTRQLLFDIQDSPIIQRYLQNICSDMQGLMQAFALEVSMRKTGIGEYEYTTMPNASVYANVYSNLLSTAARGNIKDTGWVVPSHVMPVLTEGNARERCFVMSNLLFKDPETVLVCWLLDKNRCIEPSCINEVVVNEYRQRVHVGACRRYTLGARDTFHNIRRLLCGKHTHRNKKIRFPRARGERTHFKLLECSIVPQLSTREHYMIGDYMNEHEGFLPWRTGRMYWQLKESSHFVHDANVQHQSIISGHSGHTDAMLTFSNIFNSFDLRCMTLVCVLWLCGCEHHSVFEVVITAHEHGLAYQQQDAIQFASELLRSLT